jgi:hypothetical protein
MKQVMTKEYIKSKKEIDIKDILNAYTGKTNYLDRKVPAKEEESAPTNKYALDVESFQEGGAMKKYKDYLKSQSDIGSNAAKKEMNAFANDYMKPAAKIAVTTLAAPAVGSYIGGLAAGRGLGTGLQLTDDVMVNVFGDMLGEAGKALPFASIYEFLNAKNGTLNNTPKAFRNSPAFQKLNNKTIGRNLKSNMLPTVDVKGSYYPPYKN